MSRFWSRFFHREGEVLEENAQREFALPAGRAMGLTPGWKSVRLDKSGSVSGLHLLETHWDDALINEQYWRAIHGS